MITFKKLRYKNFLSTGKYINEINLNGKSRTLISGKNGSGKSTFLDALTFALFNKPFRKINKPQLLNSINKKNLEVELELTIGKDEYLVKRGVNPLFFIIEKNGQVMNQEASVKEQQKNFEENILQMNYWSFCQIVILGSSNYTPFMQLPSYMRREVIEELLDIKIFSIMNIILKGRMLENNQALDSIKQSIRLNTERIKSQERLIETIECKDKESILKLVEEERNILKTIATLESEVFSLQDEIELVKPELNQKKIEISTKQSESFKYVTEFESKIKKLIKDKKFFESKDVCNVCKQIISSETKQASLDKINRNISKLETALEQAKIVKDRLTQKLNELTEKIDHVWKVESQIENKESQKSFYKSRIDKIRNTIDRLEQDNHSSLASEKAKLSEIHNGLAETTEMKAKLSHNKKLYDVIYELLKDTGIKSKIIKQYLPTMNKLVNKYLQDMDFFVDFRLDENFKETIKSRYRDDFCYESFSEGEKLRIDLALLFAWRALAKLKNSINVNLLILDEIFDSSLDQAGTEDFIKILNGLEDTNIFVISHKLELLQDKFEHDIRFVKRNNFSVIEETT